MANRRALLELYTVPEGSQGRKEASGVITLDKRLIKQNLILYIVDLEHQRAEEVINSRIVDFLSMGLYDIQFGDSLTPSARLEAMAKEFDGTHSRMTNQYYDTASFRTLDRDNLIKYLKDIRDASEE